MYVEVSIHQDGQDSDHHSTRYKVNGYYMVVNSEDRRITINLEAADSSHHMTERIEMERDEAMDLVSKIISILHELSKREQSELSRGEQPKFAFGVASRKAV